MSAPKPPPDVSWVKQETLYDGWIHRIFPYVVLGCGLTTSLIVALIVATL